MLEPSPSLLCPNTHACKWFCLRTQPRQEARTEGFLRHLHGLEVFNPRIQVERRGRGKMIWVTESLFSGYLFARFDLSMASETIRYAPGVSSLVSFGGKTASVENDVIDDLRAHFNDFPRMASSRSALQKGDQITLNRGPFMGMPATVIQALPGFQRVRLLMEFMGQARAVDVGAECVNFEQ